MKVTKKTKKQRKTILIYKNKILYKPTLTNKFLYRGILYYINTVTYYYYIAFFLYKSITCIGYLKYFVRYL